MNIQELALSAALTSDEEHASPEEIDLYVTGGATMALRSQIENHTAACEMCANEIGDLRQLVVSREPPLTLALSPPRAGRGDRVSPESQPPASPANDCPLPAKAGRGDRVRGGTRVAAAIIVAILGIAPFAITKIRDNADERYATVAIPAEITAMKGERLLLRGASTTSDFAVLEPLATAVISEHPTFRWTAPPDRPVSVQIFDEAFNPVAHSTSTHTGQWTPEEALPRGKTLIWQIVFEGVGRRTVAPAPPLPDARFRIVSEQDAQRIAALAERSQPSLRLASAYVEAGALDNARRELGRLEVAGRMNDASRRLLETVDNLH